MKAKVAVGMSGGVDSSVVAALLVEQGYDVAGVFIEAYNEPGCRTDEDRKDALKVAAKLGIPFQVLDFKNEYKEKVVQYFFDEYKAGRTPNPDVVCNREVKFGLFYDWALANGFSQVATGHYARILAVTQLHSDTVTRMLQQPRDLSKDQTYFLWQVKQENLKNVIFPLGNMLKKEVRGKAKILGLLNADKPDSMGVCMMGELNVREFLKEKLGENPGIVMYKGMSVGTHRGLWFATIGERVGSEVKLEGKTLQKLGLNTTKMPALYVVGKDKGKNVVQIGLREECYKTQFQISNVKCLINIEYLNNLIKVNKLSVRIRNLGELYAVSQCQSVTGGMVIMLERPVFAPAEGQSAVFYDIQGMVIGGGIIDSRD